MNESLFSNIRAAIVELDEERLIQLTETAIQSRVDPIEAVEKAYTAGIQEVGKLFERGDYFLPELIQAAEMVKQAVGEMEKHMPSGQVASKGKIVLGTVAGDVHDIGKNLVATMLATRGIEVVDIGVDCPVDEFIDRAIAENADLIGASCLLTMTALEQKKLIQRMNERGLRGRFKVIMGGAAIDPAWVKEIGADGFGANLKEAADVALSLLSEKRKGG